MPLQSRCFRGFSRDVSSYWFSDTWSGDLLISLWLFDRRRKSINIFVNFLFTSTFHLHFGVSLLSITFTLVHLMNFQGGRFFFLWQNGCGFINSMFTQIKDMLWLFLFQIISFCSFWWTVEVYRQDYKFLFMTDCSVCISPQSGAV